MSDMIEADFLGTWRIGGHDYEVFMVERLYDDAEGCHDSKLCKIFVTPGTKDQVEDRIVHEGLHALLERSGLQHMLDTKDIDTELFVRVLTVGLRATFVISLPIKEGGHLEHPAKRRARRA